MTAVKEKEPALFEAPTEAPKPLATTKQTKAKSTAVAKVEDDGADDLLILARAAANPNVDPAKMQALREIMKDIRQERREEAFTRDFIAMQAELPEINKDGRIVIDPKETARNKKRQVTPFSTFENIHRITMPICRGHGFVMWHEVDVGKEGTGVIVRSFLKHTAGHQTTSAIPLILDTTGSKNNNQGAGSSISYGKRYNTIALLNIISKSPTDADLDGAVEIGTVSAEQLETIRALIVDSGADIPRFCKHMNVESIEQIPAARFDDAIAALEKKKGAKP